MGSNSVEDGGERCKQSTYLNERVRVRSGTGNFPEQELAANGRKNEDRKTFGEEREKIDSETRVGAKQLSLSRSRETFL